MLYVIFSLVIAGLIISSTKKNKREAARKKAARAAEREWLVKSMIEPKYRVAAITIKGLDVSSTAFDPMVNPYVPLGRITSKQRATLAAENARTGGLLDSTGVNYPASSLYSIRVEKIY